MSTAKQIKTERIPISAVVGSAAFQAGVADYRRGGARFDDFSGEAAWNYERGRLFAAARKAIGLPVPAFRIGSAVSLDAIDAFTDAFRAKDVL